MIKSRIYMIIAIALTIAFASFYGGAIAYAMVYLSIALPIFALIYNFYVYKRFILRENVKTKIIVKGQKTIYRFSLSNNDIIPYVNIKVIFYDDKSLIENKSLARSYCINPNEDYNLETNITCLYRGNYNVGIKSVIITDFLNLFKITYNPNFPLKIRALPRLFTLNSVVVSLEEIETQKIKNSVINKQQQPDIDMRQYISGDNKKRIHWKVSAKKQELYTRKYSNYAEPDVFIIMDTLEISGSISEKIKNEDKIIESTLSVCDYYCRKNAPVEILYSNININKIKIDSIGSFNLFYNMCADILFHSKITPSQVLFECNDNIKRDGFFIVVTHTITDELCRACRQTVEFGNRVTIILINKEKSDDVKTNVDKRINLVTIDKDQEIIDALERK